MVVAVISKNKSKGNQENPKCICYNKKPSLQYSQTTRGVVAKSWKYDWLANLISPATDRCDSSIWTLHTHIQPYLSLLVN